MLSLARRAGTTHPEPSDPTQSRGAHLPLAIVVCAAALLVPQPRELGASPPNLGPSDAHAGKAFGMAFPERCAVFRFAPRSPTRVSSERRGKIRKSREIRDDSAAQRVNEIVLGEIDAEPFLLRAEKSLTTSDSVALA